MTLKLKVQQNFVALPVDEGDELYPNGLFEFNITKMLAFIHSSERIQPEQIKINDFYRCYSTINESHILNVDLSQPIILAEISPRNFNIIDGNHRIEKAKREEQEYILAFKIQPQDHLQFLTSKKSYKIYVDYWNEKLSELKYIS